MSLRTVSNIKRLDETMQQLQRAVGRVSQAWNDKVSSVIQANHINRIIGVCNNANKALRPKAAELEKLMQQLEDITNR